VDTTNEPVFFWSEKHKTEFSCFSNFAKIPVKAYGRVWPTSEHLFQAMKSLDAAEQEEIRKAPTPLKSKRMGRQTKLRPDWESVKYNVMVEIIRIKFASNPLRAILLSTGCRPIYEDSPYDKIWGTGTLGGTGPGLNLLGKALMQVREEFQKENCDERQPQPN